MNLISIKDTRDNLADLVDRVAIGEEEFVITKFGKPRAKLVPMEIDKEQSNLKDAFGVWKKVDPELNSAQLAKKLRVQATSRS